MDANAPASLDKHTGKKIFACDCSDAAKLLEVMHHFILLPSEKDDPTYFKLQKPLLILSV